MKHIWKNKIAVFCAVILLLGTVPSLAAPAQETVQTDGVAAYVSGGVTVDNSLFQGDLYTEGDIDINVKPAAGKTGILGTLYAPGTSVVTGAAAEAYQIERANGISWPAVNTAVLEKPEDLPERGSRYFAWNDYKKDEAGNTLYEGVAIAESGHYTSITGQGPVYFDTTENDLVITVDKIKLTNGVHVVGAGSVTIFMPADQADLVNCTVVKTDENSSFNIVAYGGDLHLKGYIGLKGNLYVPDGNVTLQKIDLVGLLVVGGTEVVFEDNNTGVKGILYAPEATVTLRNGARVFGALNAKKLQLEPGTKVQYDPSYLSLNLDDGEWDIPQSGTITPEPGDENETLPDEKPEITAPQPEDVSDLVPGLKAEYYAYFDDGKRIFPAYAKIMEQHMDEVRFNYGWGTPDEELWRKDRFSVRFTGYVVPQESGTYTFSTLSDDGIYLSVGGKEILHNWNDMALHYSYAEPVVLEAGKAYAIDLQYYDNTEISTLALFWQFDGKMELVPATTLYTEPMAEKTYFHEMDYRTKGLSIYYYNTPDGALNDAIKADAVSEGNVDFDLMGTPPVAGIDPEQYSAKFTGYLEAPATGKLTLEFIVDDGIVVEVDGKTVLNEWHENNVDHTYTVTLDVKAGDRYPITIRYNNTGMRSTCQMFWQTASMGWQVVPVEFLFS